MSKLCPEKIGRNAVTCIENALLNCSLLASDIEKKGNTMSWDGHVFVYNSSEHTKNNFMGRVPVQVKGTYKKYFDKVVVEEYASVSDLRNYLKDGGVIYFFVYMTESKNSIYYTQLLPYDLNLALREVKERNKAKIKLYKFPQNDINEMTSLFMSFISDRKKQGDIADSKLSTLEELEKNGVAIENLTFGVTGIGINEANLEEYISTHTFFVYAKLKGIEKYLPISKAENAMITRRVFAPIQINNKTFYDNYTVNYEQGELTLRIGKSFELYYPHNASATLDVKLKGNLSQRIRDTEFLLALSTNKTVSINTAEITFIDTTLTDFDNERLKRKLIQLSEIKTALDMLNVQEELDIDKLTERDNQKLHDLVRAMIYNESIPLHNTNEGSISTGFLTIANISILIVYQKVDSELNHYNISSFSKPISIKIEQSIKIDNEEILGSQYLLLDKGHYARASNLNYDDAFNSIRSYGNNRYLLDCANNNMLEVLKAYDETGKAALLELAFKLSLWIRENDRSEQGSSEIDTINYIQIRRRKGDISPQELAELYLIKRNSNDNRFLCASCILLGETEQARSHFFKLSLDEQKAFISYPVCRFWEIREDIINELDIVQ
jgi:hypothetical protein